METGIKFVENVAQADDGQQESMLNEDLGNESAIIFLPEHRLALRLPIITDNQEERLVIVRWHVEEGDIVVAEQKMVRIATMFRGIELPMPPWLDGRYRIYRIEKKREEILKAGDVLVILEALDALTGGLTCSVA